jgi:hypothetical protein
MTWSKTFLLLLSTALLASCAAPPPIEALSPLTHKATPLGHLKVVRDYTPYKPVSPRDWREQNFEVAPPVRREKR